jgi:hypothetical protein
MAANPSANHRKGVRIPDDLQGFIEFALGSRNNIPWDIHTDRADFTAGRHSVARGCIRNRNHSSLDHLGDEMTFLMTSKANGVGLHFQLSFFIRTCCPDFLFSLLFLKPSWDDFSKNRRNFSSRHICTNNISSGNWENQTRGKFCIVVYRSHRTSISPDMTR